MCVGEVHQGNWSSRHTRSHPWLTMEAPSQTYLLLVETSDGRPEPCQDQTWLLGVRDGLPRLGPHPAVTGGGLEQGEKPIALRHQNIKKTGGIVCDFNRVLNKSKV